MNAPQDSLTLETRLRDLMATWKAERRGADQVPYLQCAHDLAHVLEAHQQAANTPDTPEYWLISCLFKEDNCQIFDAIVAPLSPAVWFLKELAAGRAPVILHTCRLSKKEYATLVTMPNVVGRDLHIK